MKNNQEKPGNPTKNDEMGVDFSKNNNIIPIVINDILSLIGC